jgi:putative ABC transport system permease protein
VLTLQLSLAARYLWERKLRTFLTTLAIVFGAWVIFGMNILMPTMLKSFEANLLAASGQVDVTITLNSGETFSRNLVNKVRTIQGVSAVSGLLSRTINVPDGFFEHSKITALTLVGLDPRQAQSVRTYRMAEGRFLRSDDELAAVITTSLAESLGLKLGDKLHLPTTEGVVTLDIVGLQPARTLPGNEEVLVTLDEAQKLLDLSNRINTIEANLDTTDKAQREAILTNIKNELGPDYSLGALSCGNEFYASIQLGQAVFNLFGFFALIMGGFIIFNTFRTVVAERRHDIGMLRAVGASRRTIIGLFIAEGFVQGSVGTLVGMVLGYFSGAGLLSAMQSMFAQFLHVELGGPVIEPSLIVVTVALGVGVTILAGLLPALSASRVTPLEALRPSVSETVQRVARAGVIVGVVLIVLAIVGLFSGNVGLTALGGLSFLIGLVLVAPALVKPIASVFSALIAIAFAREGTGTLAQGNLTRQPSRSAITASATMVGLAIVVAAGGVTSSLSGTLIEIVQKSLGSDYMLMPPSVGVWASNVGANQDLANRLRAVPGVEAVSTMRFAMATIGGQSVSMLGIDPEVFPKVVGLNFTEGDANTAYAQLAEGRAMIVNGILAAQLGLRVGDSVRLSTPTGEQTYRVAAIAGDFFNAKITTAYISQVNLRVDFRKTEDIFIQLNLAPGANPAEVEPRLKAIADDYPQFKLISGKAYYEQTKQLLDVAFSMYYVLFGVLALPSLIALLNTLAIGVIERTREIGMLRAIGATRPQVRRMVIAEALLLAAIGTALGLLAGLYLSYVMVLGMSTLFPMAYSFPLGGVVAAVAVGLIFGVIAALIPARQAAGMEIVRALQYE